MFDPPAGADAIIAWTDPTVEPGLAGSTWGLGGGTYVGGEIVRGLVLIDRTHPATPGYTARAG